jgi:hypothetical protein
MGLESRFHGQQLPRGRSRLDLLPEGEPRDRTGSDPGEQLHFVCGSPFLWYSFPRTEEMKRIFIRSLVVVLALDGSGGEEVCESCVDGVCGGRVNFKEKIRNGAKPIPAAHPRRNSTTKQVIKVYFIVY